MCSNAPGVGDWVECTVASGVTQDIDIDLANPSISTSAAARAHGVYGHHQGTGRIDIDLNGAGITTEGRFANGVYGRHEGAGAVDIDIQGGSITTADSVAIGVQGRHLGGGAGGVGVSARNVVIRARGQSSHGLLGLRQGDGSGDVAVSANGAGITTEGNYAHAIMGSQGGMSTGGVSVDVRDSSLETKGLFNSYGVYGIIENAASTADVAIALSGGSVKTAGSDSYAVHAASGGAGDRVSIALNAAALTTSGARAHGVYGYRASAGGIDIDIQGGSIATTGARGHGVWGYHAGSGGIDIEMDGVAVETAGARTYGVLAYHVGASGDIAVDMRDGSVKTSGAGALGVYARNDGPGGAAFDLNGAWIETGGDGAHAVLVWVNNAASEADVSVGAAGGSVTAEGLIARGLYGVSAGLGSVSLTTGAAVKSPFFIGAEGRLTNDASAAGRLLVTNGGAVEAREVGVFAWAARSSGSTFGEGTRTADDASRIGPMIHVTSNGKLTVGAGVMDDFTRSKAAGADGTLSTNENAVLSAITAGDSTALDAALAALPASYTDDYEAEARNLLRKRGGAQASAADLASQAAGEILGLSRAGVRALALSHTGIADYVREGDRDSTILAIDEASRTEEQNAALAEQALLSTAERATLEAVLTGGDLETALGALPAAYTDDWKDGVRLRAARYNAGGVRVDITGGTIEAEGNGVEALYAVPHERNGAIAVSVAEGARVTGAMAGIRAANAGTGLRIEKRYAPRAIQEANGSLGPDDRVTVAGYLNQVARIEGVVTGGSDAAVHLVGGGGLIVGEKGQVLAGASGRAVLVNDPGPAIIYIEGEVKGGAGAPAAVHLTGGGVATIGLTGRVEANGAEMAIRGDAPATIVIHTASTTDPAALNKAGTRIEGAIGGAGVGASVIFAEVNPDTGLTTGNVTVRLNAEGALELPDIPEPSPPPSDPSPPPPTRFDCGMAEDRRCELYEALPSLLLAVNRLPSYAERMAAPRGARGVWGRVETVRGEWTADRADSARSLSYDYDITGARAGVIFYAGAGGRAGFSVHMLRAKAKMGGVGEIAVNGVGAGASATWALEDGFYLDASGQFTQLDADVDSARSGSLQKDESGLGLSLGVEAGRRMALAQGMSITPRAGLAWARAELGEFTDSVGDPAPRVWVKDAKSLNGRLGMTIDRPMATGGLFAALDLEREFFDETSVRVSDARLETERPSTALTMGVGGAFEIREGVTLRILGRYETSGSDASEFGGAVSVSGQF